MEHLSNAFAGAAPVSNSFDCDSLLSDDWQLARTARVNLLLIHQESSAAGVLDQLLPDLNEPIARWRPGQRLVLPSIHLAGTIVLQDVGALCADEQRQLLDWLEESGGRTQVVSTTAESLLARVNEGSFLDTLYYRLNTVCVESSHAC